jgi:peptidoglycan-associated lipoprotein
MKEMKKTMIVFLVLTFACASLLVMASCAKRVGTVEPSAQPAPSTMAPAPAPTPEQPTPQPMPSAKPVEEGMLKGAIEVFESTGIYFDFDKSDIKAEAKPVLEKKAEFLRANPSFKVRIEGNCDERGTNEYNMALGDRRAKAAMKYLNALGISADRMTTISYGEERPICKEHNETCWSKNRRDDFRLSQ